ncbi:MAG: response regulator, partial [Oscillospiraceae bacterium]|nr:response regulator [Oscillospiraceae bacterium]
METVKKRFVVADSDKEFVEEIKNILEKNGYTFVGSAADGIDAISECNIKLPDIIFVKKDLDFIDGFKISFNLREKGYSGLIILIGEKYSSEASKRALSCGAD